MNDLVNTVQSKSTDRVVVGVKNLAKFWSTFKERIECTVSSKPQSLLGNLARMTTYYQDKFRQNVSLTAHV